MSEEDKLKQKFVQAPEDETLEGFKKSFIDPIKLS